MENTSLANIARAYADQAQVERIPEDQVDVNAGGSSLNSAAI
jgi:hypothetical protein